MRKKEFVALGLVFVMCGSLWTGQAGTASAAGTEAEYEKDENVYGSLNEDGSVKELYVVNQFAVKKAGEIIDCGKYDSVTNLTDMNEILSENGKYKFQAKEGNFYYQGNIVSGKLPWDIAIQYFLDGKEVMAEELAGAAGKMELRIKTSKNKDVDKVFFENYMMQVSVTLDNEQCSNIKAAGAAIADAGTSRQINFTVMPGKQADIVLKADVKDFEMGGISIAAVPFSMSVDLPDTEDMTSGLLELADGIQELNDGVGELDNGTSEFADGVGEFDDGLQKINKNFGSLVSGAKSLSKGSSSINNGLQKIKKSGKSITDGSSGIAGGLSGLNKKVSSMDLSGLAPADAAYLKQMVAALDTNYGQFNQGLSQYVGGVGKLAKNYSQFDSGVSEYSGGVSKMGKGISSLAGGSAKLASGAEDLADGVSELYDGTKEMADGTADMPDEMDQEIDKMMNEYTYDFDLVSFASKENKSVNAVQFTLSTPEISVEEEETVEVKEEKKGFLERLKALF